MVSIKYDTVGLKELEQALRDLRDEMGGKEGNIVASALRVAAKDVHFAQVSTAARHQDTGTLVNSLKIRKHTNPQHWSEIIGVGVHDMGKRPRRGENQDTGKPWYANIVEFGGRGKSHPLRGFIRQSLEENRERIPRTFGRELGAKIERAAKKIGNKNIATVGARAKKL